MKLCHILTIHLCSFQKRKVTTFANCGIRGNGINRRAVYRVLQIPTKLELSIVIKICGIIFLAIWSSVMLSASMLVPARIQTNLKILLETMDKIETIIFFENGRTDYVLAEQIYYKINQFNGFDTGTIVQNKLEIQKVCICHV